MKTSTIILTVLKFFFYFTFVGLSLCVAISFILSVYSIIHFDGGSVVTKIKVTFFKGTFEQLQGKSKAVFSVLLSLLSVYFGLLANLVLKGIQIIRKINLEQPFSYKIYKIIRSIALYSFLAWTVSLIIIMLTSLFFDNKNININLDWNISDLVIFSGIIYVIGKIYQRGVILQSENELTI